MLLLASCCWPASFSPVCYLTLVPPLDVFPLPLSSLHSPSPSLSLDFASCSILPSLLLRLYISLSSSVFLVTSFLFSPHYMCISLCSRTVLWIISPQLYYFCVPGAGMFSNGCTRKRSGSGAAAADESLSSQLNGKARPMPRPAIACKYWRQSAPACGPAAPVPLPKTNLEHSY